MSSSIVSLWLIIAMIASLFSNALPNAYPLAYQINSLPEEVLEATLADVFDVAFADVTASLPAVDGATALTGIIDELGLEDATYSAALRYNTRFSTPPTLGSVSLTGVDADTVQLTFDALHTDVTVQADAESARFSLGDTVYGVKYADLFDNLFSSLPTLSAASLLSQYADIPLSVYLEDAIFLTEMLTLAQSEMIAAGFSLNDLNFTNYLSLTVDSVRLKNALTRFFTQLFAHEDEINGLIARYGKLFNLPESITCSQLRRLIMRQLSLFSTSAEHINFQIIPTDDAIHITGQYGDRNYGYGATLAVHISDEERITGSFNWADGSESTIINVELGLVSDALLSGTVEILYGNSRSVTTSCKLAVELGVNSNYSGDIDSIHLSVLPLTPIPGFSGLTANLAITNDFIWSANVVSDYFTLDVSNTYNAFNFACTLPDELALDAYLSYGYSGIRGLSVGWSDYLGEYTYLSYADNTLTLALPRETYTLTLMPEENALPEEFAHLDPFRGLYESSITLASLKQQQNYYTNAEYQTDLVMSLFPLYGSHGPMKTVSFSLEQYPVYNGQPYGRKETRSLDLTRTIAPLRRAPAAFDEASVVWLDLPQLVELIDETLNPTAEEATEGEATTAEVAP